jgi:hypothetical protein
VSGWKNPLWKKPSEWMVIGKTSKSRSARKNDTLIAALLTQAQRKVRRELARRRY